MKSCLMIMLAAGLVQCGNKTMTVSEACGVIKATLYADGNFSFQGTEIDGLTSRNQQKIVAVKSWYKKHC